MGIDLCYVATVEETEGPSLFILRQERVQAYTQTCTFLVQGNSPVSGELL